VVYDTRTCILNMYGCAKQSSPHPQSFWDASTKVGHPLAFEPEGGGEDASLNWDTMGWGYYSYPKAPLVDRFKYITRGKWMTNVW